MAIIGRKTWVIPGGHIPLHSQGPEPENTGRDELFLLNTGKVEARLEITIYYADRDPVGPYALTAPPRRVRNARFNDLIDPEALPLDTPYAAVIEANVPIVVQFGRLDSGRGMSVGFIPYTE
jgi:hypothetical protein